MGWFLNWFDNLLVYVGSVAILLPLGPHHFLFNVFTTSLNIWNIGVAPIVRLSFLQDHTVCCIGTICLYFKYLK